MSDIRPELSKKNKYWIDRHRYYELKHFVMQYPLWQTKVSYIDSLARGNISAVKYRTDYKDYVAQAVELREQYIDNINLCNNMARQTDPIIGNYILLAVINNESYEKIKARTDVPCCKDVWYDLYHKFFWLLDSTRK